MFDLDCRSVGDVTLEDGIGGEWNDGVDLNRCDIAEALTICWLLLGPFAGFCCCCCLWRLKDERRRVEDDRETSIRRSLVLVVAD